MSKYNYFSVITVDGYEFPIKPQVVFPFNSQGFTLLNRGSHIIFYSFDGTTIHGDLNPADASRNLSFDTRNECKIWFAGLDGYGTCRVESWE